jgi:hypothetical protein
LNALLNEAAAKTVMVVFGTGVGVGVEAGAGVGVGDVHPATIIADNSNVNANIAIDITFLGTMKSPPVL